MLYITLDGCLNKPKKRSKTNYPDLMRQLSPALSRLIFLCAFYLLYIVNTITEHICII